MQRTLLTYTVQLKMDMQTVIIDSRKQLGYDKLRAKHMATESLFLFQLGTLL